MGRTTRQVARVGNLMKWVSKWIGWWWVALGCVCLIKTDFGGRREKICEE